jgi:hypothetical protein
MPVNKHMKRIHEIEKEIDRILWNANTRSLKKNHPDSDRYQALKAELLQEQKYVQSHRKMGKSKFG